MLSSAWVFTFESVSKKVIYTLSSFLGDSEAFIHYHWLIALELCRGIYGNLDVIILNTDSYSDF